MSLPLLGSGPGSAASTGIAPTDPSFSSVKLLMGFNGSNGATGSPGMDDESGAAHGTGTNGGAAVISTSQSVFGGSSFSPSSSYITMPDSSDWAFSNGAFTIEFRMRSPSVSGIYFLVSQWQSPGNAFAFYQQNDTLQFHCGVTGSDDFTLAASGSILSANTWYAACVDFDASKYRMYLDGSMVASSTTVRTMPDSTRALAISGVPASGLFFYNGFMDELRITKGVARYASDSGYTVATSAFPRS